MMILSFLISHLLSLTIAQQDLCEPAVNPSPSCLCTRLDFLDTYSFRLKFGNSTFAGSKYRLISPSFKSDYDCVTEQLLQCPPPSGDGQVTAFGVFNSLYILPLGSRINDVYCYPQTRMFDMAKPKIIESQVGGHLPTGDLHLTEVGCIEYGGSNNGWEESTKKPVTAVTVPSSTSLPDDCTCSQPPPIMTQTIFDMQYAFNLPQTTFKFGVPKFSYTVGCQHVSMICPNKQKAMMFFNNKYIINGNDVLDVASKYNLHCHSASATWMFDEASEQKFKQMLGIDTIQLSYLGCATFTTRD